MTDDDRSLMVRVQGMRQELDALTNLCNGLYEAHNALHEAFLRHSHQDAPGDESPVNAAETRLERERHDG